MHDKKKPFKVTRVFDAHHSSVEAQYSKRKSATQRMYRMRARGVRVWLMVENQ